MKQTINEEVSVVVYYAATLKQSVPYLLHWQNKDYRLSAVDYYHTYMEGRERQHIYELVDKDETLWFRLRLDSSNLHWILEAIHDGLAD
jgi:hypothetical protein